MRRIPRSIRAKHNPFAHHPPGLGIWFDVMRRPGRDDPPTSNLRTGKVPSRKVQTSVPESAHTAHQESAPSPRPAPGSLPWSSARPHGYPPLLPVKRSATLPHHLLRSLRLRFFSGLPDQEYDDLPILLRHDRVRLRSSYPRSDGSLCLFDPVVARCGSSLWPVLWPWPRTSRPRPSASPFPISKAKRCSRCRPPPSSPAQSGVCLPQSRSQGPANGVVTAQTPAPGAYVIPGEVPLRLTLGTPPPGILQTFLQAFANGQKNGQQNVQVPPVTGQNRTMASHTLRPRISAPSSRAMKPASSRSSHPPPERRSIRGLP